METMFVYVFAYRGLVVFLGLLNTKEL